MDNYSKLYDETRERIFTLLNERGLSQKEFADKLEVSSQTITDWKKGKSNSFMQKLERISHALHTTPGWLVNGSGAKDFSNEQRKELEKQERLNLVNMVAASNEAENQLKKYVKDILQQTTKELGTSFSELLSRNLPLATYLGVTTSELLGEEIAPTPVAEGGPRYPPEYDLLDPEDQALIDSMIRRLILEKNQGDTSSPSNGAESETA